MAPVTGTDDQVESPADVQIGHFSGNCVAPGKRCEIRSGVQPPHTAPVDAQNPFASPLARHVRFSKSWARRPEERYAVLLALAWQWERVAVIASYLYFWLRPSQACLPHGDSPNGRQGVDLTISS